MKKIKIQVLKDWVFFKKSFNNRDFQDGVEYAKNEICKLINMETIKKGERKFEKFNKKMTKWQNADNKKNKQNQESNNRQLYLWYKR